MTVDIIGAGIGGLTTAIALQQKGINVRVFEQAAQIKPVGAGIILASNAMQVYEKLGLRKEIEKHGHSISSLNITKANFSPLSKMDLSFFEKKHKVKNIAIHRGTLQQILLDRLGENDLKLNHQLRKIESNKHGYLVSFSNGDHIQSTALIGADGIHSNVRQHIFDDNTIRNAKQVCWRGVTDFNLPENYQHELNEAWDKTARFGFVQIAKNKVYWYALKSINAHENEFQLSDIESFFRSFNPLVNNIISSTKSSQINTAQLLDLKPTKKWYKNNVCLIGDAAHATTPNMGQGACQAIEDAYVLAECMSNDDLDAAFQKFQALRMPKAHQVVKTSWMIGKLAHLSNPLLIGFRNVMIRITPSINRKQTEKLFQIPNL